MASTALMLKIGADIKSLQGDLNKANGVMSKFKGEVGKVGAILTGVFVGKSISDFVKSSVIKIAEFEKAMSAVRAVTNSTADQFEKLKINAQKLGASTEYTATQVAGLQAEFGRLGFSTEEILNATGATLNLATATGEDLARSAEIAGSTLRGFGLEATQMNRVVDVMASSFNKSALNLSNFAEAVKYVAPVAKATNSSIEETSALMSVLADAGIKGSMAGTALRRIFSELSKDGRPLADRLKELSDNGLTLADAQDEVGAYAKTALLVLSSQADKVGELTTHYKNAAGEGLKMANVMRDNLAGDVKALESAIDGAILKGEGLVKVLRKITQWSTGVIQGATGGVDRGFADQIETIERANKSLRKSFGDAFRNNDLSLMNQIEQMLMHNTNLINELSGKTKKINNENKEGNLITEKQITTLSSLNEELKKKKDYLETIDVNNKKELITTNQEIKALEAKIKKLRELGTVEAAQRITPANLNAPAVLPTLDTTSMTNIDGLTQKLSALIVPLDMAKKKMMSFGEAWAQVGMAGIDATATINAGLADMTMGIGDAIGNIASGIGGFEQIGAALLGGIAGMMNQLGQLAIGAGIAVAGIKKALMSLNPAVAIAAGVALVALSKVISNKAASIAGGGRGGSGSAGREASPQALQRVQYGNRVEIVGELKADGSVLKAVIKNQDRRDTRTGRG